MKKKPLTYGAGNKQLEVILLGELQYVVQTLDVDSHRQRNVLLTNSTEQSAEVDHPVD